MAEEVKYTSFHQELKIEDDVQPLTDEVESTDRGLFDFAKKENCDDELISSEFEEKVKVHEKKHESVLKKLHRSDSSSSSSSEEEEEVDENGEKKKKKKLKDKIKEKISGGKKEEKEVKLDYEVEDNYVPIEKHDDFPEEKKSFVEKIKDKLPGAKKSEETVDPIPSPAVDCYVPPESDQSKEKKGFLDKIKEKIPGFHHHKEDEKEKEKEVGKY